MTTAPGFQDVFVTKLNAAGNTLIYSTYFGGNDNDHSNGIAIDSEYYAYITRFTGSANLPVTTGSYDTTRSLRGDAFVTKIGGPFLVPVELSELDILD